MVNEVLLHDSHHLPPLNTHQVGIGCGVSYARHESVTVPDVIDFLLGELPRGFIQHLHSRFASCNKLVSVSANRPTQIIAESIRAGENQQQYESQLVCCEVSHGADCSKKEYNLKNDSHHTLHS